MIVRFLGAVGLAAAGAAGWQAWSERPRLPTWAHTQAETLAVSRRFGPHARVARLRVDEGGTVHLHDVRVPRREGNDATSDPGLVLPHVRVALDPLLLATGRLRPERVRVEEAQIALRETRDGVAPDFPVLPPSPDEAPEHTPHIEVVGGAVTVRAEAESERLAPGTTVHAAIEAFELQPAAPGAPLELRGSLAPQDVGSEDARITLAGTVDPDSGAFNARATWDPLELTPDLLSKLAPPLAASLQQETMQEGSLTLDLKRDADSDDTPVKLRAGWAGAVEVQPHDLPGTVTIDAQTREQLAELFGKGALKFHVEDGRVGIDRLFSQLAGGEVSATGWIDQDTGALELDFRIRRLALEDPAVRQALGEDGRALYDQFDPSGWVDAKGHVKRVPGGELVWHIDLLLEEASFRYLGAKEPDRSRDGFPYRVRDASGRVHITPQAVIFDEIIGYNRGAEVRIRSHKDRTWSDGPWGTETGRVRFDSEGPDLRLTVAVENLPIDDELNDAIRGSSFAEILDDFQLQGVIDRVEVDIIAHPEIDTAAKTEVRVTLEGEQFLYKPFPLPLEDVRGTITLRRPPLADGTRGHVYAFDVTGWADGARIQVRAMVEEHKGDGRLRIEAHDVPLEGKIGEIVMASALTGEDLGPVWRWLAPAGQADVVATLPLSNNTDPLEMEAVLENASVSLDHEESPRPLRIRKLRGPLHIRGDVVTMKNLEGRIDETPVHLEGRLAGGTIGNWDIRARAKRLRITEELLTGVRHFLPSGTLLPKGMRTEAGGTLDLTLALKRRAGGELRATAEVERVEATVRLRDGSEAQVKADAIHVRANDIVTEGMRIERDGLLVNIPAGTTSRDDEGETDLQAEVTLRLDRHRPVETELEMVPDAVRELLETWAGDRRLSSTELRIDPTDATSVLLVGDVQFHPPEQSPRPGPAGRVVFEHLRVHVPEEHPPWLEGTIRFEGFTPDTAGPAKNLHGRVHLRRLILDKRFTGRGRLEGLSGQVAGLQLRGVHAFVGVREDVLTATNLRAGFAQGTVTGTVRLHVGAPRAYEGHVRIHAMSLRSLLDTFNHQDHRYRGTVNASVTFMNPTGLMEDLAAAGQARISRGWLSEMPSARSWRSLLGNAPPRGFTHANVSFRMMHRRFVLPHMQLSGPGLSMPGRGWVDWAGNADLTFTPDVIKNLLLPGAMQGGTLRSFLRRLLPEDRLYYVRLRGKLGEAEPQIVSVFD